jgi:hypothetical protein
MVQVLIPYHLLICVQRAHLVEVYYNNINLATKLVLPE